MKVIEITEIEVKAALDVAKSEEVKNVLVALFCKGEKKPTPTLDDYTTIRSYEDACAALKCSPIDEKAKYFGQQFIELWFDYLMFNVKKVQE